MRKTTTDRGPQTADDGRRTTDRRPAVADHRPSSAKSRIVTPRPTVFEQRETLPRMRVGAGRQRSLRVETRPIPKPKPFRWPTVNLRLTELTPARATSFILALACVALIAFFLLADGFYVYSAEITGNRLVSQQDIYARSGIDGRNVFMLRPDATAQQLRDVPFIKNARVRVELPARVRIEIEEREPVALWQVAGNAYGIADDGTVLPPDGLAPGAPVIQAEGASLQLGAKISSEIIAVIRHIQALIPDAQRLIFSTERGVGIVTAQGWPVYFGKKDEAIAARVAVLNGLTRELKQQRIEPEFIDLQSNARPYYRIKSAPR